MERTFLLIGAVSGLVGVGLGAFGTHALRSRLAPERLAQFETGVRYQLWHALALFGVVLVGSLRVVSGAEMYGLLVSAGAMDWPAALAGWLFVAGTVLFSGSLYALALTGVRRWGAVAPLGGTCLLLGWAALVFAAATA
ncbi:MAG TPA: DUF423 domain-containing protein [Actinomycetota bacterium]|nr:DUF423 domain-containing protein [Actinomycetota bacterium]